MRQIRFDKLKQIAEDNVSSYCVLYWAAACLAFWASGATDGQKVQAIDMICDNAKLTVPQEVLLKQLFQELTKEELWHY